MLNFAVFKIKNDMNQLQNINDLRDEIVGIESKIIAITGVNHDVCNHWAEDRAKREAVDHMLKRRCYLLNSMFVPSAENMFRFKRVNDHLYTLTQKMLSRIAGINATTYYVADEHEFDDNEMVEGFLRVDFKDDSSVLKLDDDDFYCSNFVLMIKALIELYEKYGLQNVEFSDNGINIHDKGKSWMEAPFCNWSKFNDIIICHAVHNLTNHKSFSLPDLLRLNDYLCEVRIRFQSITRQDGNRLRK